MVKISGSARSTASSWAGDLGKAEGTVGSLILGLYDGGDLRPVGHCAGFPRARKVTLRDELGAVRDRRPGSGDASRWDGDRDLEWVEMRPELVAEVGYDHASDGRIRHGARLCAGATTATRGRARSIRPRPGG